jgi:hypothetical protein
MPNEKETKISKGSQNLEGLFSLESLLSLQGVTAATLLVTNVLIYLIGSSVVPYQKWIALVISLGLSLWTATLAPKAGSGKWRWVLAILNGLLIFASSAGLNQMGAAATGGMTLGAEHITFFHSWF